MSPNSDENRLLERGIEMLREPVVLDAGLDARIMRAVGDLPQPVRAGPARRAGRWLVRPRTVRIRPAVALAAAAAVIVAVAGLWDRSAPAAPANLAASAASGAPTVRFTLVAPGASTVSLVGDFNDWQAGATPMEGPVTDGVWTVTVPLAPGRYRYAFLVDGTTWMPDPDAPRAIDDDFGRPNSVLTIGGT
jgi:hypothetical protein